MTKRRPAAALPTLTIAAVEALICGEGVVYRDGSELGIVWWDGRTRRTVVLRSLN